MGKRRIAPTELALGSVLAWDAHDEHGRLLLRRGQVITSTSQIDGLMERGLFVETDPARENPEAAKEELDPSAVSLILEARRRLQLLSSVNSAKQNFAQQVLAIRMMIAQACCLSQDAALATALLARVGRYSIRHSLDVAITCHIVGNSLGMEESDLSSTIAAALTMNLSILQLQDELQAQKEPLTDDQREIIRRHPEDSAALLRERGVTDATWLHVVLSHHESIDGSGYRMGRKGDEIPLPSQLVSLGDIYCARISSREYRRALRPNAALKALFLDQGKKVRDGLASQFIKAIGVFPAGTPVRLDNGEIAVVTHRGDTASTPHVCSVIGPRGMPLVAPIKRDTSLATYGVREVVEWTELGATPSMQSLWGKVAAIH